MDARRSQDFLEMEALAISAIAAVQKAGVMGDVTRRLFEREPSELLEQIPDVETGGELRYRPMVELLLHEIVAIGADPTLNAVEQQRRIAWALDMSGF